MVALVFAVHCYVVACYAMLCYALLDRVCGPDTAYGGMLDVV